MSERAVMRAIYGKWAAAARELEATISRLTQEREETRRYLVVMLAEFGDEDTWEGVYLADVARRLEKWLGELEPAGPPQWASESEKKP